MWPGSPVAGSRADAEKDQCTPKRMKKRKHCDSQADRRAKAHRRPKLKRNSRPRIPSVPRPPMPIPWCTLPKLRTTPLETDSPSLLLAIVAQVGCHKHISSVPTFPDRADMIDAAPERGLVVPQRFMLQRCWLRLRLSYELQSETLLAKPVPSNSRVDLVKARRAVPHGPGNP